jgi:hypothetical protein
MRNIRLDSRPLTIIITLILSGCGGPASQAVQTGPIPPPQSGIKTQSQHLIYVANGSYPAGTVTVYDRDAKENQTPVETIAGKNTGMLQPSGIAVDTAGRIYVSDFFAGPGYAGSVFVYAAGANGDVKPIATITNGINMPKGIALDGSGNVYVANFEGPGVTVYSAGTYALLRTIGVHANLGYVQGVAVDPSGKTFVINANYTGAPVMSNSGASIFVFAAGTSRLIQTITGSRTGMVTLEGVAAGSKGQIFVTNYPMHGTIQILAFSATANGNVKPVRVVHGRKTLLEGPGLALSAQGTIFATNSGYSSGANSVTVYPADASGNIAPKRQLEGRDTGLDQPAAIALH